MASANLYRPMIWIEKSVLVDQAFILDSEISIRLKLSEVTRCPRSMAQKTWRGSSKSVLVRSRAHRSVPGSGMNPAALATREAKLMQPYPSENSSEHSPDPAAHLDGHALPHPAVHPDTTLLEGFLRGALSAAECRTVVRHLLTGCPHCVKVTGRCWPPGSKIPR